MDILDTILDAMNATEIPLVDALMQLRQWNIWCATNLQVPKVQANCSPR